MRCPKCDTFFNRIIDSRQVDNARKTRRRYECWSDECKEQKIRFSTIEVPVDEYKALLLKHDNSDFTKEIKELKIVIAWLCRCLFNESFNNNILAVRKYVLDPSQQMKDRLAKLHIDIHSYQ